MEMADKHTFCMSMTSFTNMYIVSAGRIINYIPVILIILYETHHLNLLKYHWNLLMVNFSIEKEWMLAM